MSFSGTLMLLRELSFRQAQQLTESPLNIEIDKSGLQLQIRTSLEDPTEELQKVINQLKGLQHVVNGTVEEVEGQRCFVILGNRLKLLVAGQVRRMDNQKYTEDLTNDRSVSA